MEQTPTADDRRRVTVTGIGRAAVPADAALVHLGVEVTATTPGEALAASADTERQMVAAVLAAGVAESGIATRWATVEPQWEHYGERPRLRGYTARVDVQVTVDDLGSAGAVASAAVDAGGDVARLHGLTPIVRDRAAGEALARESAFADARAKAEQYARLAGQRTGRLLDLTDAVTDVGRYEPHAVMAAHRSGEPLEVRAGEHEISVTVRAAWELTD